MLNLKNLRTQRRMEKLGHKIFGPFVVTWKMGSRAYEIELPERWDIQPLFHVSLLEPYREDPVGRIQKKIPTPEMVDKEPSYVVEEAVDSRWYRNHKSKFQHSFVQYMVAWEGYCPEDNSWELFEMLEDTAMQALHEFHDRYPSKPKDHRVIDNRHHGTKRGR